MIKNCVSFIANRVLSATNRRRGMVDGRLGDLLFKFLYSAYTEDASGVRILKNELSEIFKSLDDEHDSERIEMAWVLCYLAELGVIKWSPKLNSFCIREFNKSFYPLLMHYRTNGTLYMLGCAQVWFRVGGATLSHYIVEEQLILQISMAYETLAQHGVRNIPPPVICMMLGFANLAKNRHIYPYKSLQIIRLIELVTERDTLKWISSYEIDLLLIDMILGRRYRLTQCGRMFTLCQDLVLLRKVAIYSLLFDGMHLLRETLGYIEEKYDEGLGILKKENGMSLSVIGAALMSCISYGEK
jgi:hypothetical protein